MIDIQHAKIILSIDRNDYRSRAIIKKQIPREFYEYSPKPYLAPRFNEMSKNIDAYSMEVYTLRILPGIINVLEELASKILCKFTNGERRAIYRNLNNAN